MQRKTVTIREDQEEWIQSNHLNLSSFIREEIDEWMEKGDVPTRQRDIGTISPTPQNQKLPLINEDRRVAFRGGYGSAIPSWSAIDSLGATQSQENAVVYIPLRTTRCDHHELTEYLERAVSRLGVEGGPEHFSFTLQCNDFGWYGSGVEEFRADITTPWETAESLKQQLEQEDETLKIGCPAFGAIADCDTGCFWLSLRTRSSEPPTYEVQSGIIVNQPLFSWENLSDFLQSGGPVFQHQCEGETFELSLAQYPLRDTQPAHILNGTADTIGAANPLCGENILPGDPTIESAVTKPSHLPWRIKGRGEESPSEDEFNVRSLTITCLHIPCVPGIVPAFIDSSAWKI